MKLKSLAVRKGHLAFKIPCEKCGKRNEGLSILNLVQRSKRPKDNLIVCSDCRKEEEAKLKISKKLKPVTIPKELKREIKAEKVKEKFTRNEKAALEKEWFNKQIAAGKKCEKCPRSENLTIDHIVPESLLKQFGIDIEREFIGENLRVLCRPCNVFKGNQLDFSTPKTKEILLKLIEKL